MSRYDILFEPVRIGPVTAPNRFYQVPHCNALGWQRPRSEAAMRGVKAEGGWGVVCTQETEIHPSSEISPAMEGRLWDEQDIPAHRLLTDAVHAHGSLAGIELVYNGHHASNLYTRIAPMSVSAMPVDSNEPMQARAMTLKDIAALRRWHVEAALRARAAGYDIIYVYAGHNMTTLMHFLLSRYNHRQDAYGGSLQNRVRLTREILQDVKDAVGDTCAVAFRFATDELMGADGLQAEGEGAEIVAELAELPDLWDVNISNWGHDSATARFEPQEGYQEPYTAFVKTLTSKPVVGVGRFTSADAMVSQINRGVLDFIGAARPSIADPFLPSKIRDERLDEIRECIGCNICVAGDNTLSPMRCTQNPTVGEEWRRRWHPEQAEAASGVEPVLIIGAGPAGLECALHLSQRGVEVTLADQAAVAGGRARLEATLPGLASYARVADYRISRLQQAANVQLLLHNEIVADDVAATDFPNVVVATGSHWCRRGAGREHPEGIAGIEQWQQQGRVFTPDDVLAGRLPAGRVLVYDDDHYYLGGVLAQRLAEAGCEVTLATPDARVSSWTVNTLEQTKIHQRLLQHGVAVQTSRAFALGDDGIGALSCVYGGDAIAIDINAVVLVTSRVSNSELFEALQAHAETFTSSRAFTSLQAIGDCNAPSMIAAAVYDGHRIARELGVVSDPYAPLFRREHAAALV